MHPPASSLPVPYYISTNNNNQSGYPPHSPASAPPLPCLHSLGAVQFNLLAAISVAGPGGDYRSAFEWYAKWYDPATDSFLPGTPPTCWFVDQVLSVGAPNRPDLPAFIQYTGTSQAAPAVSGVAALMIHDAAVRQGVDLCAASRAGLKGRARGPLNVAQVGRTVR